MKLYYIPIEPLPERYTESWYRNFPDIFRTYGYEEVIVIDGAPLSSHVQVGTFLDINSTIAYKNSQMLKVASLFHEGKIKDTDTFFFGDAEFWGLESLRLMAQMNNIKIKIFAFLHAASYTKEDAFEIAAPYQKYTELGWLMACDKIFVGSRYHREAVIERRVTPYASREDAEILKSKIYVTGNPLFKEDYDLGLPASAVIAKMNKLIISNRFDWEKRPNLSLDFAIILKDKHPDLNIVVTTSRPKFKSNKKWLVDYARILEKRGVIEIYEGLSKREYHIQLAESKIMLSNSIEENFGYCIAEAMIFNTYPLVRRGLSHTELVQHDPRLLFTDEDEIVEKVDKLLLSHMDVTPYVNSYYTAAGKIASEMRRTD